VRSRHETDQRSHPGAAALCLAAAGVVALGSPAWPATDYFAVAAKGGGDPTSYVHIFSYDTITTSVTFRTTITNTTGGNMDMGLSALPNYGFIVGHRYPPSVDRYATTDQITWTNDLRLDIAQTGPGAFWDSGVRTNRDPAKTENYCVGAAMLADGKVFITSDRIQSNTCYYGLGNVRGLSGTVTSIFPRDLDHLGVLANTAGAAEGTLWDVASTIAGRANRFVTCNRNINGAVMVYNADGTYRGAVTPVGTNLRGLGVFKSLSMGDVILQVDCGSDFRSTISVRGICVDDARFNTPAFTFTYRYNADYGFNQNQTPDVDGLESGRIIVLGMIRIESPYRQEPGLMIFESSNGGTTWTPAFSRPMFLSDAINAPGGVGGQTVAGLSSIPKRLNGTVVCFH
jgi:hypothetical protein